MTGRSARWGRRFAGLALLLLAITPGAAAAVGRSDAVAKPATIAAAQAVEHATVPALPRAQGGHLLSRGTDGSSPVIVAATFALLVALGCRLAAHRSPRRAAVVRASSRRERAPPRSS